MITTIALIGATEPIGASIAMNLANESYRLLLFGDDERKIKKLSKEIKRNHPSTDVQCYNCVVDASWEADIIISAVLARNEKQMAEKIKVCCNSKDYHGYFGISGCSRHQSGI